MHFGLIILQVEKLRSAALALDNERDNILSSLDAVFNSQLVDKLEKSVDVDEINRYIERLTRRCLAVQVDVKTERSPPQVDSLNKVEDITNCNS